MIFKSLSRMMARATPTLFFATAATMALSGALLSGCGSSSSDESRHIAQTVTANKLGIVSTHLQENNGYVHINGTQQFTVIGVKADGSRVDLSDKTIWRVSDRTIGSINDKGFFKPTGTVGELTLTAMFAGQTHTQQIIVSNADLVNVTIQNPATSVNVCMNTQFTAEATFDNGLTLTYPLTWSLAENAELAKFSDANAPILSTYKSGVVSVIATGKNNAGTNIQSSPLELTIADTLTQLALTASSDEELTLREGDETKITATATYVDGTTADITGNATLRATPTNAASIDDSGKLIAKTGSHTGTAVTVSGVCDEITAELSLTIMKADIDSIEVQSGDGNSNGVSLAEGSSTTLRVVATYVDNKGTETNYQHNLEWSINEDEPNNFDREKITIDTNGRIQAAGDLDLTLSIIVVVQARVLDENGNTLRNRDGEELIDRINVTITPN